MSSEPDTRKDAAPRLHYFDMLKGIAIFMVVMGHVLTMCVREIDRAAIFKFIGEIHMPLFFFISGWFTFRHSGDGRLRLPSLGQRALQLLVPMVVVSTLWMFYFPHSGLKSPLDMSFSGLWGNEWKNGYWFTGVLFQIILVYCAVASFIFRPDRRVWSQIALVVALWTLVLAVVAVSPGEFLGWSSFRLTAMFTPVFMAGALARCHSHSFGRFVSSGTSVTVALIVGAVLLYFICWPWEFTSLTEAFPQSVDIARTLFHIALAIVAISVVRPWSERAFSPGSTSFSRSVAGLWTLLGQRSLSIYLLHYFFLFPLAPCREALMALGLGFTPLLVFSATVAAAIVAVTLGADAVIRRSPLLALLLTGRIPVRK